MLITGVLAGAYFGKLWHLLLTNLNSAWVLDSGSIAASLLTVTLSLVCGGMYALAVALVWTASAKGSVAVVVCILFLGRLLYPVACDSHESFVDEPNKVCECSGTTLAYYPQGTMDGSEIEYCIGLERDLT